MWHKYARTSPSILEGSETFQGTNKSVLDFWRWAFSDLRVNTIRPVVAEYLVALAVGADHTPREEWANYDILTPEGVRVEVKSSAYCQSWSQRKPSPIQFGRLCGQEWDPETLLWSSDRRYRADVYVFAVQTCQQPDCYDSTDVSQWVFHVLPARVARTFGDRTSIGYSVILQHVPLGVRWEQLREAIITAAALEKASSQL